MTPLLLYGQRRKAASEVFRLLKPNAPLSGPRRLLKAADAKDSYVLLYSKGSGFVGFFTVYFRPGSSDVLYATVSK